MEIYNPLIELDWLIGRWSSSSVSRDLRTPNILVIEKFSPEMLKFTFVRKTNETEIPIEEMFLIFDKTGQQVYGYIFNTEGYFELCKVGLKRKEMRLVFEKGINLPPNMLIKHVFLLDKKKPALTYQFLLGKNNHQQVLVEFSKEQINGF